MCVVFSALLFRILWALYKIIIINQSWLIALIFMDFALSLTHRTFNTIWVHGIDAFAFVVKYFPCGKVHVSIYFSSSAKSTNLSLFCSLSFKCFFVGLFIIDILVCFSHAFIHTVFNVQALWVHQCLLFGPWTSNFKWNNRKKSNGNNSQKFVLSNISAFEWLTTPQANE